MKKPLAAPVVSGLCCPWCVQLMSKCTSAGVRAERNMLPSMTEGVGG